MGWRAFVGPIVCVASLGVAAGAYSQTSSRAAGPPTTGQAPSPATGGRPSSNAVAPAGRQAQTPQNQAPQPLASQPQAPQSGPASPVTEGTVSPGRITTAPGAAGSSPPAQPPPRRPRPYRPSSRTPPRQPPRYRPPPRSYRPPGQRPYRPGPHFPSPRYSRPPAYPPPERLPPLAYSRPPRPPRLTPDPTLDGAVALVIDWPAAVRAASSLENRLRFAGAGGFVVANRDTIDSLDLPVLLPPDPGLLGGAKLYAHGDFFTLSLSYQGMSLVLTGHARAFPLSAGAATMLPPEGLAARIPADGVVIEASEAGVDADFQMFGAVYGLALECEDLTEDPRCRDEGYVRGLISGLTVVLPAGGG